MPKKRIKLIRMFQLITIVSLISLATIIMILHISIQSREFKNRAEEMRSSYLAQQKKMIKREVERVISLVSDERSRSEEETREVVKQRVYEAAAVAENIYQQNKTIRSDQEIKRMIVDALRGIRFEKGTGYYFIVDLQGISQLHAAHPAFEKTSVLNLQDPRQRFIIRDMIDIVKQSGEGFYEYLWTKPAESGSDHKKISYVKLFKPFPWYVGTGLYVEDIEAQIKADLLLSISKVRFGKNGYIFVNRLNGDALVSNGKVITETKKLWEVFNKKPEKTKTIFSQEYDAALKPHGDYIYYTLGKLTDPGKEFEKVSFVHGIPELQWLVGAGVYLDKIERHIALLQSDINKQQRSEIRSILLITGILIIFSFLLLQLLSRHMAKEFNLFSAFFDQLVQENKEIDRSRIRFEEFYQVAGNANIMLQNNLSVAEKLRLSEEKYRIFFENSANAMLMIHNKKFVDCNTAAHKLLGYEDKEKIVNLHPEKLSPEYQPSGRKSLLEADRMMQIAMVEGSHRFEWQHKRKNGEIVPVEVSLTAVPVGGEIFLHVIWWDISQRKQAEEQLQRSEERFRTMAELLPEAIFETDVELNLIYANQQAANIFGYTQEEIAVGLKSSDMFLPEEMPRLLDNVAAQFRGEKSSRSEYLCRKKDGSTFPTLFRVSPILKNGKPDGIRGVVIDLTEQKRAVAQLNESEERFRNLAELLPEAVFETNLEMTLTYANKRAFELYGYTEEDYRRGLHSLNMFAPEEREKVLNNTKAQFSGVKHSSTEYLSVRKDGTVFPALFHVSPIIKDGKPAGLRGLIVDLSEHKKAEEEILKLRKLESVGVLAGGIAHDFNNLLAGLFGNIEMAKRFLSVEDRAYKYLHSASISMERATSLTKQLLTFSKGGDPIKEPLALAEIIDETASFSLRGSNVKLQLNIAADLWLVDADKGQLSQVISNLVINGKQAMPDGGIITISAENRDAEDGREVQICVQDQGIGIAPQYLNRVFDPYFSTKQQGNGLGLASCHSIITKHGGKITVTSELNQGTTFTMTLPAIEGEIGPQISNSEEEIICGNTIARILLLDDEELIQQVSGAMLEEMGHQVDYAITGEEAVTKYQTAQKDNHGYDLVICDLTIPGEMGGQDAAQKILSTNPQAKLIVSSGYATDPVMADYTEYGFKGRVAKPYLFADLEKVIQQVLDL